MVDMKEVASVRFVDAESEDEALAIIRASHRMVGIAFSLKGNGDLEVFLQPQDCRKLVAKLQEALTLTEK